MRAEGVTERAGDVVLQCSGVAPGLLSTGLTVLFPVTVTNRVDANGVAAGAVLSIDYGGGFVPTGIGGRVTNQYIAFNGIGITVPAGGSFNLQLSGVRLNAYQLGTTAPPPITASVSFGLPLNQSQVVVGYPRAGLTTTFSEAGIPCTGSKLPSTLNMANLFAAGTAFASTRLTEGVAGAFAPRAGDEDSGTRFLVQYSGLPEGASLYVPDYVAGSDALVPTAGGDLGVAQNSGQYAPGSRTLLLVRVLGADASGAGGTAAQVPTATTVLNSVSAVPLTGGSGYAVYEVADANPAALQSVQFPVFVGLSTVAETSNARETVMLAPVTTVFGASMTAPVPRFAAVIPASDCSVAGTCAPPALSIYPSGTIILSAVGGKLMGEPPAISVRNTGDGTLNWTVSVGYGSGSGWLATDAAAGQNNGTIRLTVKPQGLKAGRYSAMVSVDGGSGPQSVAVVLIVKDAPRSTPVPDIAAVVSAASFEAVPAVAGSLTTLMGSNLAGTSVQVTFDGLPATLLYTSATQINLQVPPGVGSKTSASMVVTVDGASSTPQTVALAAAWPAIFAGGVLNQDNTVNAPGSPALAGRFLQIFATGIPTGATVSARISDYQDLVPAYAGEAPTLTGVQQVNVAVPDGAAAGTIPLVVCATAGGRQYCSGSYSLTIQ